MSIQAGGDPEFVIHDRRGKPVSAHTIGLPNIKTDKRAVSGGFYGYDGYALEINPDPASCRAYVSEHTKNILRYIEQAHLVGNYEGYSIKAISAFPITKSSLVGAPDSARFFGCDPSNDGYTESVKRMEVDAMATLIRFCGGHLHWGTEVCSEATDAFGNVVKVGTRNALNTPEKHNGLARLMDEYLGVPMAHIWHGPEQFIRRTYYGQAGEFRTQFYNERWQGFEYRTPPSEMWMHQAMFGLFSGVGRWVINNYDRLIKSEDKGRWDSVRAAINHGEGTKSLLKSVPNYYDASTIDKLRNAVQIREFFMLNRKAPEAHTGWGEYADEWGLGSGWRA